MYAAIASMLALATLAMLAMLGTLTMLGPPSWPHTSPLAPACQLPPLLQDPSASLAPKAPPVGAAGQDELAHGCLPGC